MVCYSEYATPQANITYRVAIPDTAVEPPFDVFLQIIAPSNTTGWAGLAWGGRMVGNPLTVVWPYNGTGLASSRWATSHSTPQAYSGTTLTVLPSSYTNATHWQLDILCSGCSLWQNGTLDPLGRNQLAWAKGSDAVFVPASNTSNFAYHDAKGVFEHDLTDARVPHDVFDSLAAGRGIDGGAGLPPTLGSGPLSTWPRPPMTTPTLRHPTTSLNITITSILPPSDEPSTTTITTTTTLVTLRELEENHATDHVLEDSHIKADEDDYYFANHSHDLSAFRHLRDVNHYCHHSRLHSEGTKKTKRQKKEG
ncbi:hypothetical protein VTK73DRAFT_3446 [Phialemonium thermophilum]|uniref:Cellobiose dehydrogenase-like cytochrome domain-containing protein n=1 Tax=Phialemonium thermophilum TaxID=223376 RepID=A0ABR3WYW1_9PEZI